MELNAAPTPTEDNSHTLSTVALTLIVLETTAVAVRFLSRYLSKAGFWWDDWLILGALPLIIGVNVSLWIHAAHGLGKHATTASEGSAYFFAVLYPERILYIVGFALVKMSVLLFYRRIFPGHRFKQALWIVGSLVVGWGVSMTITSALQCIPVRKSWNPSIPGKCINLHAYYFGQAIPNSITDGIILLLPLPSLWKLQVPKPQKIALIAIFFLGGFVVVMSIVRLTTFVHLGGDTHRDVTWNYTFPSMWSSVEPSIGIVSACLPSMVYLFKNLVSFFTPRGKSDASNGHAVPKRWSRRGTSERSFVQLRDDRSRLGEAYSAAALSYDAAKGAEGDEVPLGRIAVRRDVELEYT